MIPIANVRDAALPWQRDPFHVAARYKLLESWWEVGGLQARYIEIEVGGRILPHAPQQGELLYCLAGEGLFTLEEEAVTIRAGDCFAAPRGCIQGLVNEGEEALHLLSIQLPDRRTHLLARLFELLNRKSPRGRETDGRR